jgi:K(+)-stimulated pyrophosphate-energized sodium pump
MVYAIVLSLIVLALFYIFLNYRAIRKLPEGNSEMVEMAGIIRDGATTFLRTEFKMIVAVVLFIAFVFSLLIEKLSGLTLIMGALMSSLVCIIGMKSATYANVRTANKAKDSLSVGETVKVALKGGSISGLSVQAFGLLGFVKARFLYEQVLGILLSFFVYQGL